MENLASKYMTMDQYAEHRACSKRTVERWVKMPNFPSIKQGVKMRRIVWEEADRFVDAGGLEKKRAPRNQRTAA